MAESGGLENRWAFTRPVGSNPTPSAIFLLELLGFFTSTPLNFSMRIV